MVISKDFIFETFDDAMNVHKKLFEIMREKGNVSYGDLYSLVYKDCEITNPEYYTLGWNSVWQVKLEPLNDNDCQWVLRMPTIESIKKKDNK